jgi:hypothetical protein
MASGGVGQTAADDAGKRRRCMSTLGGVSSVLAIVLVATVSARLFFSSFLVHCSVHCQCPFPVRVASRFAWSSYRAGTVQGGQQTVRFVRPTGSGPGPGTRKYLPARPHLWCPFCSVASLARRYEAVHFHCALSSPHYPVPCSLFTSTSFPLLLARVPCCPASC